MPMNYSIYNATSSHLEAVLALNESVVPHVNSLEMTDMQDFLDKAVYFRVACDEGTQVVAFLIGLDADTEYDSPNFQWFCRKYKRFAYIDRIAVAATAQRQGIAEALYTDFADLAHNWAPRLCCEVNVRPANPGSMAFHERLGFKQIGTQEIHNGNKQVALLSKDIHEVN